MEPVLPVTTHVDIGTSDDIHHFRRIGIDLRPALSLVVSPHQAWLAMAILAIFAVLAKGTSIVALVTTDRIVLASDGVVTKIEGGVTSFPPFCKIRKSGPVWYAIAGDYGIPGTASDVWRIAENSIARSKTITGIYAAVSPMMLEQLPNIVELNRVGDPKTYSGWIAGDPVIEMMFAGFDSSNPIVIGVSFYIDTRGRAVNPPSRDIVRPTKGNITAGRIGHHYDIERVLPSRSWQQSFRFAPVEAAHELIQAEIDAGIREKRYDVGLPISIVNITASTWAWAEGYEGVCPEK